MDTCKATEFIDTKSKTPKITTTLYDLLSEINSNYLGPQWELADGGRFICATEIIL